MISVPKGTKDVLPQESYKWQYIENAARKVAKTFGAAEIRTPTFEHTEVFLRGVGETTDIVNKEMYTFLDKGGRSITLKPEGTAGVARAFVDNGLFSSALPSKLFYITQCFRYERPQAGRLREFHQFGIEFLGASDANIDAEVILLADSFLKEVGINNVTLYINSIGCKECRKKYQQALIEYLGKNAEDLCPLCKDRLAKNPLRVLDCKNDDCKKITAGAPKILDYICDDCSKHFEKVKRLLTVAGVDYKVDAGIVRGLDYYTRTVFEFVSNNIGAQGTVCGGGRYDGLIAELGGNDVPGIGFAVGIERILMLLENTGVEIPNPDKVKVYLAPMGEKEAEKAFELASLLRARGVAADFDHMGRGIKAQFKYADKIGVRYVAVIGSDELNNGAVKLKDMTDGKEEILKFSELVNKEF
ncbi:MAG: histidine--tRNA ligase [Clostridiales bacterium]|nr:histidine--tRNA ligase [Clostridiales bacterium]MBQ3046888.1 histidine--tRNA ligase [Clostridia bacterium]